MSAYYHGTLKTADVIGKDTVDLIPGQYTNIGELVVAADEQIGMGYGNDNTQQNAQGRIFVGLHTADGTDISGKFRIIQVSSQNIPIGSQPVLLDVDLAALCQGEHDRIGQIAFPWNKTLLSKDKKFQFQVLNDTAAVQTVSKAHSNILMDITRKLV